MAASATTAGAAGGWTTTTSSPPPSSDAHPLRYTRAAVLHPWGLACGAVERAGVGAARSGAPYRRASQYERGPDAEARCVS